MQEDPLGGAVGLESHDLVHEGAEGSDAGLGHAAAEDAGPMKIPGGEILEGALAPGGCRG